MKKAAQICENIFGWGVYLCLIAGGLAFFGFLVALAMGGGADSSAQALAVFIQKEYFPILIKCSAAAVGFGLLAMYLNKEDALSLKSDKREAEEELAAIKAESNE